MFEKRQMNRKRRILTDDKIKTGSADFLVMNNERKCKEKSSKRRIVSIV